MNELFEKVMELIHEEGKDLSRSEYQDLLHSIIDDCKSELRAMDEDEDEDEDDDLYMSLD